jgi:peptide/nickel transport system ATP-binding protein
MTPSTVLDVSGLRVAFAGGAEAVRGVSFAIERGQTHCLVGESGCGKSATSLALMGLLPRGARRDAGHIRFQGQDIASFSDRQMRPLRGNRMAMIFQEPMTSLNPAFTVGAQLAEVYMRHRGASRAAAMVRAEAMLQRVEISAPALRLHQYPHQLSGGLRQRVMIAMALMCDPELLIADEPTTALDVTVQAQILRLLRKLQQETGLAMLLITHDMGVVARMADRVSVMYAGEVIESGAAAQVFARPSHPYTRGLLGCIPVPGQQDRGRPLPTIPGLVPSLVAGLRGCAFRERCAHAHTGCTGDIPRQQAAPGHGYLCTHDTAPITQEAA